MVDEIYTIDQIKALLTPIFIQNSVDKAVLFGSYSKEIATNKSDVDILVDSNLKGLKFVGLMEQISSVLNKNIDVFDVKHIQENSKIEKEIKDTGVLIYER